MRAWQARPLPELLPVLLSLLAVIGPLGCAAHHSSGDPSEFPCDEVGYSLWNCTLPSDCYFNGVIPNVACTLDAAVQCTGSRTTHLDVVCRYCWQLPSHLVACDAPSDCQTFMYRKHRTVCQAKESEVCLGARRFHKFVQCQRQGHSAWSTALALSTLGGGLAMDRFYLGYSWQGFLKLVTLGGLGVWTLLDFILVLTGYLTPADGTRFLDLL